MKVPQPPVSDTVTRASAEQEKSKGAALEAPLQMTAIKFKTSADFAVLDTDKTVEFEKYVDFVVSLNETQTLFNIQEELFRIIDPSPNDKKAFEYIQSKLTIIELEKENKIDLKEDLDLEENKKKRERPLSNELLIDFKEEKRNKLDPKDYTRGLHTGEKEETLHEEPAVDLAMKWLQGTATHAITPSRKAEIILKIISNEKLKGDNAIKQLIIDIFENSFLFETTIILKKVSVDGLILFLDSSNSLKKTRRTIDSSDFKRILKAQLENKPTATKKANSTITDPVTLAWTVAELLYEADNGFEVLKYLSEKEFIHFYNEVKSVVLRYVKDTWKREVSKNIAGLESPSGGTVAWLKMKQGLSEFISTIVHEHLHFLEKDLGESKPKDANESEVYAHTGENKWIYKHGFPVKKKFLNKKNELNLGAIEKHALLETTKSNNDIDVNEVAKVDKETGKVKLTDESDWSNPQDGQWTAFYDFVPAENDELATERHDKFHIALLFALDDLQGEIFKN